MRALEQLLGEAPALRALAPAHRATIAGCARNRVFEPGDGCSARAIRRTRSSSSARGAVALETQVPGRGAVTLETLGAGDLLGWSWLVPPYRSALRRARAGHRARDRARRRLPARQVRRRIRRSATTCSRCVAAVFVERLEETRLRLLDLYAVVPAMPEPPRRLPRRGPAVARPATPGRCALEPADGDGAGRLRARASSRCSTRSAPARCRSRSARSRTGRRARAHGPRRRRRHRGRCAPRSRATCSGVRGPFGHGWPLEAAEGRDVVIVAGGTRARAAAPGRPRAARRSRALRRRRGALRRAHARRPALPRRARGAGDAAATIDVELTVDAPDAGLERPRRRGHAADPRGPTSIPPAPLAMVCGPEVMMRFAAARAARARRRAGADDLGLAGAQHEVRDRPLRALPARPAVRLQGRPGGPARPRRAAHADGGAVSPRRTLAVWKFASCDGCQLSLLDCEDELLPLAGELDIAYFLEAGPRARGGHLRPLARRGLDHHARGRRAHPRDPRALAAPGHDRRLRRPPAASRRCATSPTSRTSCRSSTRRPSTSPRSPPRRRSSEHVRGRLRAAGLPDRQAASCSRSSAPSCNDRRPAIGRPQRLRRVQAARQRLRDGRPRHAVPRPGHARRLRRAVPELPPRLLRLLRPDGGAERRRSLGAWLAGTAWPSATLVRALPHLQRRRAGVRRARMAERELVTASPLARVEGEGALHVRLRDGRVEDVRLRIYEPPRFFEAFLRGRALHRGARHHRADLRHLPGRLPD